MISLFVNSRGESELFKTCYERKLPLLIKGPTGCGKSQLVQSMAEALNVPIIKVACNEDTSSADLLGRFLIRATEGATETIWQDGPVTRAVRQGGILYLDEIAEAREDVIVALHPLTDHRRELYIDRLNETVRAPDGFMVVASFNPGYQKGFKELKPSTRQRFVTLNMDYLDLEKEAELLVRLTEISEKVALQLVKLASRIRKTPELNLTETLSTRLLVHTAQLIVGGRMPSRQAAYVGIAEVLSDERDIVQALYDLIDLSL